MARRIDFKTKFDSWLDAMDESQFVRFADFVGKEIEIINAFTYIGKEGTKTAGKEGFTAMFKADGKTYYSTSFGSVIVKQGKEIIEVLNAIGDEGVLVTVRKKTSKVSGSEYVYFG